MKLGHVAIDPDDIQVVYNADGTLGLSGDVRPYDTPEATRARFLQMRSLVGVLPLVMDDSSFDAEDLAGLYRVTQNRVRLGGGSLADAGGPWSLTLESLATGSIEGEVASVGAMLPVVSPVTFSATSARVGVPGDLVGHGASVVGDETIDLTEGRVRTVAMSTGAQRWTAFACAPDEWLAGSPRVQIQLAGAWWTIHGQPPAGVPVRVHNGRVGLRVKTGGAAMAALRLATTGAVDRTYALSLTDSGGLVGVDEAAGVEVVRSDSEMVWLRWVQQRTSFGTRQAAPLTSDLVVRRGVGGLTLSTSKQMDLSVAATNNGAIQDSAATTTVGAAAGDLNFVSQREVTVSGTTSTSIKAPQILRIETPSNYRTRTWAAPTISVLT